MAVTNVLRIRRTDKADQYILLHVEQTGSRPLDLKLIGSEHTALFHGSFKESEVKSLQANNYRGDIDEWKAILKYALQHQRPEGVSSETLEGLEIVAAIHSKALNVTLRKNIGGITQRLGSISLNEDTSREEVSIFEWVDTAAADADDLRTQLATLQASVSSQQDQVARLTKQLDDLITAKKEHEDELFKKFAALLNAKKLKIRDQQRLLSGAKVDAEAAEAVSTARSGSSKGRKAAASREGKRKANGSAKPEADEMDVEDDEEADEDDELREQVETPPASDNDATENEDDLDGFAPGPSSSKANAKRELIVSSPQQPEEAMDVGEPAEPPPRRELPFGNKKAEPVEEPVSGPANGDNDETDDEL